MYLPGRLVVTLIVGIAVGPMLIGPAVARQASDSSTEGLPYVERGEPREQRWEDLRDAGERACTQAFESAAVLGERLHDLQRNLSRVLVQVSGELTRGAARGMDQLADRLHEMAERMDRPAE